MTLPQPTPQPSQGGSGNLPPRGGRRRRSLPKVVSIKEAQAWLRAPLNLRDKALVSLAYSTACRVSELVAARLEDVDASRGRIALRRRKTQDIHEVALGRALARLQRYLRQDGRAFKAEGPLFLSRQSGVQHLQPGVQPDSDRIPGNPGGISTGPQPESGWPHRRKGKTWGERGELGEKGEKRGLSKRQAQRILTQSALDAGIHPLKAHAHTLRHSRLTHIYEATGDLLVCQALAGHASIQTTTIYAHLAVGRLDAITTEHDL